MSKRPHYTELAFHYLRLAVRKPIVKDEVSQHWFNIATDWLSSLPLDDRDYLTRVCLSNSYNKPTTERLHKLFADFAKYTELI